MTTDRSRVNVKLAIRNGRGIGAVHGLHESNLRRDLGLKIERLGSGFYFVLFGRDLKPEDDWTAKHKVSPIEVFSLVQDCRKTWVRKVVDLAEEVDSPTGMKREFPFKDRWDHANQKDVWLQEIGASLAVAGAQLFYSLFIRDADERMTRLAAELRRLSGSRELNITITSSDFFIPWGLLYTHPDKSHELAVDGRNFLWEGFWGYRHIVEHNPERSELPKGLKPDTDGRLVTSFNMDHRIDAQLGVDCIQPQRTFFKNLSGWGVTERTKKPEFIQAIASEKFADQIVYFCCHGVGSDDPAQVTAELARLTLGDDEPIKATDIDYHMRGHDFASHPIVFINACQNGQMTTLFYQTVAERLLKKKASGLIGAQIDMPAIFAAEFAKRFFSGFFARQGENRILIGPVLRSITRELLLKHKNPLGLAYSLYRGMDCFIDWGENSEPPSPT